MVRKKHEKSKRGSKQTSDAFLNQVEILGGKGVIYTTPYSNGNYYFRTWIKDEKKYIRKSLRTKIYEFLKDEIKKEGIKKKSDEELSNIFN